MKMISQEEQTSVKTWGSHGSSFRKQWHRVCCWHYWCSDFKWQV